jgi:hypothetical protein
MRWFSTPASAEAREISALAICETVLASSASLWIVVRFETTAHILAGMAIAPFLLLRTPQSTLVGIRTLTSIMDAILSFGDRCISGHIKGLFGFFGKAVQGVTVMPIAFISPSLARVWATLVTAIRAPANTIASIPSNWQRYCLSMDTMHPPEMVPGMELVRPTSVAYLHVSEFLTNSGKLYFTRGDRTLLVFVAQLPLALLAVALCLAAFWLPAILYRWSLKSTTLVYLPLLWIIHQAKRPDASLRDHLDDLSWKPFERLRRIYSWFVVVALTVIPLFLVLQAMHVSNWVAEHIHPALAKIWFFSGLQIQFWHIARSLCALITIFLAYYAVYLVKCRLDRDREVEPHNLLLLKVLTVVRSALALFVLGCTIWILSTEFDWSAIRIRFP